MSSATETATPQIASSKVNKADIIKWAVTILVPLIVWMIPMPFEHNIKAFLIITSWAITCWVTLVLPIEVTGVLIPCSFLLFKVAEPAVIFAPWTNTVVWGTIALLMIGTAAMNSGLSTRLAYSLLVKMNTSLKGLIWGFSIAGIVLSFIITDSFVRAVVFVTIAIGICKALDIAPRSKEATALTLAAFLGMAGPCIGSLPAGNGLQVNSVFHATTGVYITYAQWLLHNFVPSLAWTVVGVFCILKVLKIGNDSRFDAKEELNRRYEEMGKMSRREKFVLLFLLMVVIDYMGATYVGLDPLLIPVFFVPFMFLPGVNALTAKDFEEMDLKIVFVITGALCLGATAANVGLVDLLIEHLTPLVAGSPVKMVMGTFFFTMLAKFILTPIAIIFTFADLFIKMALAAGFNPLPVVYALNFATDTYIFPYEYVILLVAFSFGYMNYKDTIKVLLARTLLSIVVISLVSVPFWKLIGLL